MIARSYTLQERRPDAVDNLSHAAPVIPLRPILSLDALGRETCHCATVLDVGQPIFTLNARSALALALRHAKIGQGNSVLVPAYHCPAMVSPLEWLGVEPIFFPIRPDTTIDVEILANYVRPNTRALIAVHYFGFIQDMQPLRRFCDEHGLILIEDCAHAFFGSVDGQPLGRYGDYAIASLMKFLPIDEGGCLVSSRLSLADLKMNYGGSFFQVKSALNTLEIANEYERLPWLKYLLGLKNWLWEFLKNQNEPSERSSFASTNEEFRNTEFEFQPTRVSKSMSWSSFAIMKAMSFSLACSRRRDNYKTLLKAFSNIPGGRPLYDKLPDGVYPQVFPMLMDEPENVFHTLKSKGVPIIRFGEFRWKGVDESTCPVSQYLSRSVFQFPCHQSLTGEELDWMIETVLSVLRDTQRGVACHG